MISRLHSSPLILQCLNTTSINCAVRASILGSVCPWDICFFVSFPAFCMGMKNRIRFRLMRLADIWPVDRLHQVHRVQTISDAIFVIICQNQKREVARSSVPVPSHLWLSGLWTTKLLPIGSTESVANYWEDVKINKNMLNEQEVVRSTPQRRRHIASNASEWKTLCILVKAFSVFVGIYRCSETRVYRLSYCLFVYSLSLSSIKRWTRRRRLNQITASEMSSIGEMGRSD